VPLGAVVEPLFLLVVEPGVARVAGHRRHPRAALSSLPSVTGFGLAQEGEGLASLLLLLPVPLRLLGGGGAVVKGCGLVGEVAAGRGRGGGKVGEGERRPRLLLTLALGSVSRLPPPFSWALFKLQAHSLSYDR
jgi:hypothetical protein